MKAKQRQELERSRSPLSSSKSYDQESMLSALSDMTGQSTKERFYRKWEKVIKSGIEPDYSSLNPIAAKLIQKDEPAILTINRL